MGFHGIYRAIFDYAPQADGELPINEGDLLYILDKNSEDGWWRAKKKANTEDGDEPVGLVPFNYVEEAQPLAQARAIYEYTRQTDEELSFPEDANLAVYDASDGDWILVGLGNDFGFVPANYIEIQDAGNDNSAQAQPEPPSLPARPTPPSPGPATPSEFASATPSPPASIPVNSSTKGPAGALASVMHSHRLHQASPHVAPSPQSSEFRAVDEGNEETKRAPQLPARPASQTSPQARSESPRHSHVTDKVQVEQPAPRVPGGFHMYNINEMVTIMGKRKKMPTTLGINLGTGTILIAPERTQDGPTQEWTADNMTHYSREGKHVFLELVRPSKSVDFHAGAKDTAEEIVEALGELAGAVKARGLREVILAGSNHRQKRGKVLYDFMAQGADEVTVAVDDEVIILDDNKSDEWWHVRQVKTGKEGVVPSSYIEVTGTVSPPPNASGLNAGLSVVEQNRQEEIRLTKEAMRAAQRDDQQNQVGPGMPLPERGSSLLAREYDNNSGQRKKHESGQRGSTNARKSRPDADKVRTWTDRSKSFSVEAQFLGLKDGKINLHKMNGVKIAVPIAKMSLEDLEYVEQLTGISLDEDKPLSNVKKSSKGNSDASEISNIRGKTVAGASVQHSHPQKLECDWFQFFLSCDVAVGLCERYAQAFTKESMDESVLPDVDATVLRNLGLREGDILKVMRALDAKFGRTGLRRKRNTDEAGSDDEGGTEGGLFSGSGGLLRNNTRKGRPAPTVQASDVVDAKVLTTQSEDKSQSDKATLSTNLPGKSKAMGFDDDAWDIKPAKKTEEQEKLATAESFKPSASLTNSMQELSLLTAPLEPSRPQTQSNVPAPSHTVPAESMQVTEQNPQQSGTTPAFYTTTSPNSPASKQRQRPIPTPIAPAQMSALIPPPATRPVSAPQSTQPSVFIPPTLGPHVGATPQTRVAPPGQSLEEISQDRARQQFVGQMQPFQMVSFPGKQQASDTPPFTVNHQVIQPMVTGMTTFGEPGRLPSGSLHPQGAGYPTSYSPSLPLQSQSASNFNSALPSTLQPQQPGMLPFQPQLTGSDPHKVLPPLQPLQPQKTGPAPPVRFGVTGEAKSLAPQPTGRRANLAQATPNNPFGF